MKKKIIALFLFATLMLGLTACSEAEAEATKLVIAARGGSHVDAMNAVKEKFEQENNVTIEILGLEGADLKQKISLDSKNATASYDLIMADDPWMPELCEAEIFANLDELGVSGDEDFESASLNLGKYPYATGKLYALPFSGNVQLFFYNKEIFSSEGLDVPTSWEEVLSAAKEISETEGHIGYAVRGQQGNPIVSDFLPVYWAFGGSVFNDDWTAAFNNETGIDALNMYIELYNAGANYEKADIVSSVSEGSAGMSLGWPSWYISGENASAEYAPIPSKAYNSSMESSTGMIGNWMMGVTNNSVNKEIAAKFLTYITSSEIQKEMVNFGGVPTRKSVYLDEELIAKNKHFPIQLEALTNSVARPRTPKWSEVETILGAELSAALAGTKSVEDALAAAEVEINALMQ